MRAYVPAAAAAAWLLAAPPAPAQDGAAAPLFSADQLADILRPAVPAPVPAAATEADGMPMPRTRGLAPGSGPEAGLEAGPEPGPAPEPGSSGSGVLPDLRLLFGYDSDKLTGQARAQLDELARALGRDDMRDYRFVVGGHTDAEGDDGYNEDLSRRRAVAVVAYLAGSHGVPSGRLAAVGHGERELAEPDDPTSGRNRRVEVRTLPAGD